MNQYNRDIKCRAKRAMTIAVIGCLIFTFTLGAELWWEDTSVAYATESPEVVGSGAIVYCATTGDVLWSKKMNRQFNPASMTKLLTCLIAAEVLGLDTEVTVDEEATNTKVTEHVVYSGENISVRELVYLSLLISANDAAKALAIATSGDEENFAKLMNDKAAAIGCENSKFCNASGLYVSEENNNVSTAYDMALIAYECFKNPELREIAGTAQHTVPATNVTEERVINSTNCFLEGGEVKTSDGSLTVEKYDGVIGGKTGTTDESKATMVVGLTTQGMEVYAVTMDSLPSQRFSDIKRMLDFAKEVVNPYKVFDEGCEFDETKIRYGAENRIVGVSDKAVTINLPEGASAALVTTEAVYNETLEAPIEAGQSIGSINVYLAEECLTTVDLVAKTGVEKGWFLSGLYITNTQTIIILASLFTLILLFVLVLVIRARNIKKRKEERRKEIYRLAMEEIARQDAENNRKTKGHHYDDRYYR